MNADKDNLTVTIVLDTAICLRLYLPILIRVYPRESAAGYLVLISVYPWKSVAKTMESDPFLWRFAQLAFSAWRSIYRIDDLNES